MTDSDETLLKSFAIHRDESAFRALAGRHLGLIFHTALRRTQNRQIAEEVSQNILCALAKKAPSLAKKPELLPAWLHRATLFESSKAMRAEISHQRRNQLAHPDESSPETPAWIDALPHLDAALDKLPDSDRRVLLLHFFENRTFPGIARSLGKSTSAIQKQSQRALEKLARLLRARGVTLTATAIATGLSAELAKAAPVTVLKSATAAALTGSATYSTTGLTLMFAAKSKALVPVAATLCLTPLALQQVAISHAEARIARYQATPTASEADHGSVRKPAASRSSRKISGNTDILVLINECDEARQTFGADWHRFQQKLSSLDSDTLERLIHDCAALNVHREKRSNLLTELVVALAEKDAGHAVRFTIEAIPNGPDFQSLLIATNLGRPFALWAQADPASALEWFRQIENEPKFHRSVHAPMDAIDHLRTPLVNALVLTGSPELRNFLLAIPDQERSRLLNSAINNGLGSMRRFEITGAAPMDNLPAYIPIIREFIPEDLREQALETLSSQFSTSPEGQLADVRSFFARASMTPAEAEFIAVKLGTRMLRVGEDLNQAHLLEPAIRELTAWLQSEFPDHADNLMEQAQTEALKSETNRAQWVVHMLKDRRASDDEIARQLTRYSMRTRLPEALKIAETIGNPDLRNSIVDHLNQQHPTTPPP